MPNSPARCLIGYLVTGAVLSCLTLIVLQIIAEVEAWVPEQDQAVIADVRLDLSLSDSKTAITSHKYTDLGFRILARSSPEPDASNDEFFRRLLKEGQRGNTGLGKYKISTENGGIALFIIPLDNPLVLIIDNSLSEGLQLLGIDKETADRMERGAIEQDKQFL